MSNPMKVIKTPITLDRERTLCYDLNAFVVLEEKFGSEKKAIEALAAGTIKALRTFIWAGLLHEDETLTEKEVGSMLTVHNATEFSEKLLLAVSGTLPEAKN
ncbi:MAG: hypothetical protein AB2401_00415 [Bacillus sp. (in: firmicutes)]